MDSINHNGGNAAGALVLGGDYQGLGIVRSLGRRNVPAGVVDDEMSIAGCSRYAVFSDRIASLGDGKATVQSLLEVGRKRKLCGWVLYATRDETVAILSQNREELGQMFRVTTPPWESIKWIWDKRNTYALAEKLGIPAPRTWHGDELNDLGKLDGHYPVALKPAIKENFIYETGAKAWRADNAAQLRKLLESAAKFMPRDQIMVQDLVPGDGSCQYAFCAFFKQGQAQASVVTCRRRQHPFEFGRASTYVESVEMPLLEEYSTQFLRAIDFYGLVEMEFKRDARDGQYRLLDVNGRTWGYHTIGRLAGVDFPFLLFADQMNQPIEMCRGKAGVRWIRLLTDVPTGILGILTGRLNGRAYLRSLFDYDEEAVFSREDPLPGLFEVALLPYLSVRRGF
jgi:D-aspartate ligase